MSAAGNSRDDSNAVHASSLPPLMRNFSEIVTAWLADVGRTRRPKTRQAYQIAIDKFAEVVPEMWDRFITRADLVRFRDHRADTCSVISANRDLKAPKACLNWAWTNELPQPQVPLMRLLLPHPPRRDQTLTSEEVERLFAAAQFDLPVAAVLHICHGTGFRLGEALNLLWSDIDFADGSPSRTAFGCDAQLLTASISGGWTASRWYSAIAPSGIGACPRSVGPHQRGDSRSVSRPRTANATAPFSEVSVQVTSNLSAPRKSIVGYAAEPSPAGSGTGSPGASSRSATKIRVAPSPLLSL